MLDRLRRVDRNIHRPQAQDGKIGQRPFRTVLGDDSDTVAGLYAEARKAGRDSPDALDRLDAGKIVPRIAYLVGKRDLLVVAAKRLDAKMRQRLRDGVESDEVFSRHQWL